MKHATKGNASKINSTSGNSDCDLSEFSLSTKQKNLCNQICVSLSNADSTDQVYYLTPEGYVVLRSRKSNRFYKHPADLHLLDLLHYENKEYSWNAFTKASSEGKISKTSHKLSTEKNEYRWYDVLFSPVVIEGKVLRIIAFVTDIHEEKVKNEKNRYMAELLDHVGQSIIVNDLDGKVAFANQTTKTLFGWSPEDMIGKDYSILLPENHSINTQEIIETLFSDNSWQGEIFLKHRTGKIIPVLSSNSPLYDSEGEINGIVSISGDISHVKRIENALSLSEKKYRRMFLLNPQPMMIYDTENLRFLEVNEAAAQKYGYSKKEFLEMTLRDICPDGEQTFPGEQTFNDGPYRTFKFYRHIRKNGEIIFVEVTLQRIIHQGKSANHMLLHDITEQKEAAQAISEWKQRYEKVTAASGQVAYEFNMTKNQLIWGGSVRSVLGYSDQELNGPVSLWISLIHPEDLPLALKLQKEAVKSKIRKNVQYRIKHKDGHYIYLQETGILMDHTREEDQIMIGMIQDVTESKRSAEALRESMARFKATFNSAFQFIGLLDTTGNIHEANNTFIKFLRKSKEEVIGKYICQMLGDNERPQLTKIIQNAVKTAALGQFTRHELNLRHFSDKNTFIDFSVSPVKNDDGSIRMLVFEGRDITQLREKEEMALIMERAFEKSTNGVAIADARLPGMPLIMVNEAFEKTTGYKSDEILGRNARFMQGPETDQPNMKLVRNALKKGIECRTEVINYNKSGEKYWSELYLAPVKNDTGLVTHFLGINNNITERKKEQEELERYRVSLEEMVKDRTEELKIAYERAEGANKAKSTFLANMSHEIRTPLNAIIGFSEILMSKIEDKKQNSQLQSIRSSGRNLLNIINDILDLSKIEAGKMAIKKEPVNLRNIISDLEKIYSEKAKEKNIVFFTENQKSIPPSLLLDPVRLQQVLVNLVSNAIKFTHEGHVILTIDTKNRKKDTLDLVFKIEDTGIGIPGKDLTHIFQPFFQPETQQESIYGGSGLGLPISKSITEAMGGILSVASSQDKGSIFEVCLKHVTVSQEEFWIEENPKAFHSSVSFGPANVIIADDNKENRELLIDLLDNPSINFHHAENGKEAIKLATEVSPDLILMDLRMPEINGYEATRIIKNNIAQKNITIIGISASVKFLPGDESPLDIFDDFITKPLNIPQFIELLKKHLPYSVSKNKAYNEVLLTENPEYSDYDQQKLTDLAFILKKKYVTLHKEIIRNKLMDEIQGFGYQLLQESKTYDFEPLSIYANTIISLADQFEVEKLQNVLNLFPEIVEKLKSYLEN
ncbi:MAG: PAS domain S-box protein [Bacteroidetes bacterium]|nr:MAG: PAS domain S-box protein [Bacteroidota bacterium]